MKILIALTTLLLVLGCSSTEPSKPSVDFGSLRMVYTAATIPSSGQVGDTVYGVQATVQDEDGDTLKDSYVFLNVNGQNNRIIGDTALGGFNIARSDAQGVITFGVVLDTLAGVNIINAVSIRINLADTSVALIPSTYTIDGTAGEAYYISCPYREGFEYGDCDVYQPVLFQIGDTITAADFIQNGQMGLRDTAGQFKAFQAVDRYRNPTIALPKLYLSPDTTVTQLVVDSTTQGQVYTVVEGKVRYLVTASHVESFILILVESGWCQRGSWACTDANQRMFKVAP